MTLILYLLDPNVLIHLVRSNRTGKYIQRVYNLLLAEPRPIISVVTEGELRSFAQRCRWGKAKLEQMEFLLGYFKRVTIDNPDILQAYANIDAFSEEQGYSMGKNDVWIAATAQVSNAHLLTADKDFDHLDPLFLKHDWIDPAQERQSKNGAGKNDSPAE